MNGAELKTPRAPDASAISESASLRSISPQQWKSGIAAWLGWTFDGLELHLYTLVALPFVAELLGNLPTTDPAVGRYSSIVQGAFLLGWAFGGGFFGRVGDRLGRAKTLSLTVLTYAVFTGLSYFAQTWWHLMIFRFLAALGVGGEWAVGASLLSETWPRKWRPWIAAVLQSGVNVGILIAVAAHLLIEKPRLLFLVGVLPAFLVFWIRRAVPETDEWQAAKVKSQHRAPALPELFRGEVKRITIWTLLVCGISLTAHWAFMFWYAQHLRNLPEVLTWDESRKHHLVDTAMFIVIGSSIVGNFASAWVARRIGYRATIGIIFFFYFMAVFGAYCVARDYRALLWWFPVIGFCQGVFGLFTMYLPPLFPTLLRTTGSGFCYNFGRVISAFGVVFFGLFSKVGDHRLALFYSGFLFLPAAGIAFLMPRAKD
jgi:MFS family permease